MWRTRMSNRNFIFVFNCWRPLVFGAMVFFVSIFSSGIPSRAGEFCQTLTKIVASSLENFETLKGNKDVVDSWHGNVLFEDLGDHECYVEGYEGQNVYYCSTRKSSSFNDVRSTFNYVLESIDGCKNSIASDWSVSRGGGVGKRSASERISFTTEALSLSIKISFQYRIIKKNGAFRWISKG